MEIAFGTGHWTQVIAVSAKFVLAVDVNSAVIAQAEKR